MKNERDFETYVQEKAVQRIYQKERRVGLWLRAGGAVLSCAILLLGAFAWRLAEPGAPSILPAASGEGERSTTGEPHPSLTTVTQIRNPLPLYDAFSEQEIRCILPQDVILWKGFELTGTVFLNAEEGDADTIRELCDKLLDSAHHLTEDATYIEIYWVTYSMSFRCDGGIVEVQVMGQDYMKVILYEPESHREIQSMIVEFDAEYGMDLRTYLSDLYESEEKTEEPMLRR